MAGPVPAIHALLYGGALKTWMPGIMPRMTNAGGDSIIP
jgi:hypothetical protein